MCTVSMVFDHFEEPFRPWTTPRPSISPWPPTVDNAELQELRKLIAEFREALAAAKTVDRLTKQPDCEDPKKATLEERVAALEKRLEELRA